MKESVLKWKYQSKSVSPSFGPTNQQCNVGVTLTKNYLKLKPSTFFPSHHGETESRSLEFFEFSSLP